MPRSSRVATTPSAREQRMVLVRRDVVAEWLLSRGLGEVEFCQQIGMHPATYRRIKQGERVERSTARRLASAMGVTDVRELLDGEATDSIPSHKSDRPLAVDEWDVIEPLGDWIKASNGLQYRAYKMQNRYSPEQLARGKCYELDGLYDQERDRVQSAFTRHSDVCRRVGSHPNLPVSYRSSPDPMGRFWWIIDSWPSGRMLAEHFQGTRCPVEMLKPLMTQLALGLQVLHAADVVRRELAPRNIFFDANSRQVELTDFELGKLLDTSITVSKGPWRADPYRAPEVGKGRASPAVDYFSWGRIFVHAATGSLPDNGKEDAALKSVILPRGLREFVSACVDVIPLNRPKAFDPVLKVLANWV